MSHYAFALQFPICFGLCLVVVGDIVLYTTLGIAACLTFVFNMYLWFRITMCSVGYVGKMFC
jgi:preprotein translocase subunit SecD